MQASLLLLFLIQNSGVFLKNKTPNPEPDFFDLVGMSVERDWVTASLIRLFGSEKHIPDPSFSLIKLSEEEHSALFDGLSSEEADDLYIGSGLF